MKRFSLLLLCLIALAPGCRRDDAQNTPEAHAFSAQEQDKVRLDEISTQMWDAMDISSRDELPAYLKDHFRRERNGLLSSTFVLDSEDGEVARVTLGLSGLKLSIDALLMGSLILSGTIRPGAIPRGEEPLSQRLIEALDQGTDVSITENGRRLGKLGFEAIHEWGAGEDHWRIDPVIRFDDGTAYSVSGLLLIEPLLELFMKDEGASS